ncbi:peptidoglycan DD-metalloendopeptidase family protein [Pontibacter oryzae]|uniref:Peptidase M23 n=1 Tax=Pontibacter oryzae TaxID=2304593 RepID=A0A399SHU1_9BACT|nr:peptidoglycan DD-metalloendopeptidase family protein [Pontibacter oryzae]RIJ42591.1 peptidase M23 [Pontibacter oryzae]
MKNLKNLSAILSRHSHAFGPVVAPDLNAANVCLLDFTSNNTLLQNTDLRDTTAFNAALEKMLAQKRATVGIGGYLENRFIYRRSSHFDVSAESRNLHLGVDIWAAAGTEVYSPLDASVHSFQDNDNFGDYGPTIILQHELEGTTFYTLYGHLNREALHGLQQGQLIAKGQKIAEIGPYPENGNWPPHLHFQVIADMGDKYGDFPGVATSADRETYAQLCPNPNLILQCRYLSSACKTL